MPETTPRINGINVVRSEMTPVAMLDCRTNMRISGTSSPSSLAPPTGNRRSATAPTAEITIVEIVCATTIATSASRHAEGRGDHDREEAKRGRSRLVHAPQVVAAVEEQRRRPDVLGRLDQREERRREERLLQSVGIEDLVGEGREGDDEKRREHASHDLEQQRLPEEATQTPPVLARDVPEAVLRERLLHGEVEERLEEAHDDERRHEHAEVVEPEDARRDDRPAMPHATAA